jgi:hypothetical protein
MPAYGSVLGDVGVTRRSGSAHREATAVIKHHIGPIRSIQVVQAQQQLVQASLQEMAALTQERLLLSRHLLQGSAEAAEDAARSLLAHPGTGPGLSASDRKHRQSG